MNQTAPSDERTLARFGYRQELKRTQGYFSSFAVHSGGGGRRRGVVLSAALPLE
jgi:hypothetical protein